MARYAKGANAERELIHKLYRSGFSIARVAGSGSSSLPCPDLIALTSNKRLAFECKAHDSNYLNIPVQQMEELISWAGNAGTEFFIAWKLPRKGWHFLGPKLFKKNKANYSISKEQAIKEAVSFNVMIGRQSTLKK